MLPFGAALEAKDAEAAVPLLSEDVVFRSPIVFKPYHGPDAVALILDVVSRVVEDFRYTREIGAPGACDHALVFCARVGRLEIEGCDFLHLVRTARACSPTRWLTPAPATGWRVRRLSLLNATQPHFVGPRSTCRWTSHTPTHFNALRLTRRNARGGRPFRLTVTRLEAVHRR